MPGHKTHEKIGLLSIVPIAATALYFGHSIQETAVLAVGTAFSTYYLSPDLDHDVGAASYRRWGLLRFIWYPYKKLIPHRSWLSHSGPISATLRIGYLYILMLPFILYFSLSAPINNLQFRTFCVILWLSVVLADSVHVLLDMFWKETQ